MIPGKLFDFTVGLLARSLDLRSSRHRVLSSNIANVDTPDFHPREIPFQEILERSIQGKSAISLQQTHPGHLSIPFDGEIDPQPSPGELNLDQEMARLAENNLMFLAGVQTLVKKLETLRIAILEGR